MAVLEAVARALLGPDARCPNDPIWHVLADLDNRPFDVPAGRALDAAVAGETAYRIPAAWLEDAAVDAPVRGRWRVEDGRLQVWTGCGCVADVPVDGDPTRQAAEEWERVPADGDLHRADGGSGPPSRPQPPACAPALARWASRTAPYLRHRLAAALPPTDIADTDNTAAAADTWMADLFAVDGRLYVTDTNVDVVLPLAASRFDVRVAGLDRNPGWWSAGARVVRFHFVSRES